MRRLVEAHSPVAIGAGWSSLVARKAHNLEVSGSNPLPATKAVLVIATLTSQNKSCYSVGWVSFGPALNTARVHSFRA
jgi:hypothetical protein